MENRYRIGVDVGGTGAKAGIVDLQLGTIVSERLRYDTPNNAEAIFRTVVRLIQELQRDPRVGQAPVGVAFPSVIKAGTIMTAANIDPATLGRNVAHELAPEITSQLAVLNDADAAALAEVSYGVIRSKPEFRHAESVMVLTLGTGIGSGLIYQNQLIPNFELGHLELDGEVAETRAAASAIERDGLGWAEYANRVNRYLAHVHRLFFPDVFVLGGGVSREAEAFLPHISAQCPVAVAQLRADAGIIGAARAALDRHG
ncbi:polyphosphate--glucose phosphotransferase [Micrococcoides hystricis]|uniref:Polyphosphate--glucose phosphotransferase n=1 Tax=Micrococcoides hystricis TaxID=1572761 RepID=A0ABV6P6T8_9MICC